MSRKAAAYQQYLARKRMVMDYARQVSCLQQDPVPSAMWKLNARALNLHDAWRSEPGSHKARTQVCWLTLPEEQRRARLMHAWGQCAGSYLASLLAGQVYAIPGVAADLERAPTEAIKLPAAPYITSSACDHFAHSHSN